MTLCVLEITARVVLATHWWQKEVVSNVVPNPCPLSVSIAKLAIASVCEWYPLHARP
jgi:hypothetical protein